MAHDVFISHSAKDKVTADAVCAMLESEGVRCWIAPRDVLPSMEWSEAIIDAIEECRIMVLVFTANANDSPQIRREVERAVNHGVAILPVRIEDVLPGKGLEYFIGNVHWLDALKPPLDTHLRNLAGTIKIVLARAERLIVPQAPQPGAPGPAPSAESPRLAESRPAAGATEIPHIPQPAVMGKPFEQPEGSGKRNFGEWQSGGGAVAAAPPRRIPAWAWGGGVVAALLLVAVFAAVHFTSRSAPVGSPQAAPEPVQGSPLTGGPGGAAPAASPSPTPAPMQGVTRTAGPGGAVPAAPAATPPATPEAAAGKAPSLENTMETLQNELSSIGTVNFTVFGRNTANGVAGQYAAAQQFRNVVANPTQCRVSYHWTVWRNGAAQPVIDKDAWFLLRDVTSVVVEPQSQFVTQNNATGGQPNIVATSTAPAITTLVVHSQSWVNPLPFTDSGSAYRAAKTVTEAVRLCGGHLAN
jgi:hypothetical protein